MNLRDYGSPGKGGARAPVRRIEEGTGPSTKYFDSLLVGILSKVKVTHHAGGSLSRATLATSLVTPDSSPYLCTLTGDCNLGSAHSGTEDCATFRKVWAGYPPFMHEPDTHLERAEPKEGPSERTAGGPSIFDHRSWWKFDLQLFRKDPVLDNSAGWLLIQLQNAHERVLSGLTDLDRLLEKPDPNIPSYLALRSRLSSATRAQSFAVQAAHEYLLDRADQATEEELARLFHARRSTLGLSAEHLSTWSSWAISVSWSRHRSAQRALRSHWVDLVELEKHALYPMLARHAQ